MISAGENITLVSSKIGAGNEAYLVAGNRIDLLADHDTEHRLDSETRSNSSRHDQVTQVTTVGSEISAGSDITLLSGGDQTYQAAKLDSGNDLAIVSGGGVTFEATKDLHQEDHQKSSDGFSHYSAKGRGVTDETLRQSQLLAQGDILIHAVDGLKIDYKQLDKQSVGQAIDAMVKADPNLAWLKDAQARGDVDWQAVKEVHDSYRKSHSGIGAGALIVIAIVATAATYGAASGVVGSTAGATAGSGSVMAAGTVTTTTAAGVTTATSVAAGWGNVMAATALSSAAGTGAASFVNNGGNLGQTLQDMTSADALRAYATAAAIAGFGAGITDGWGRQLTPEGNYQLVDYGERLKAYVANTALKGALSGEDKDAWLSIAATGALMEVYQYSVGRGPDVRPGVDRPEGGQYKPSSDEFVPMVSFDNSMREGKNIGLNKVLSDDLCKDFYSICHGTPVSDGLNKVPGFNSFATLHDQWMINLEEFKQAPMSVLENLGSMPPALIINYGSIYDKYRPVIENLDHDK